MRLMRVGEVGHERPALLGRDGLVRSLEGVVGDLDRSFWEEGGLEAVRACVVREADLPTLDVDRIRVGPPVARPGTLVCVGLNYADHAREAGVEPPTEPVLFLKSTSTVVGPYDHIRVPRASTRPDWEVELAVVIGKTARYLDDDERAAACIGGYTISHDVSERAFQFSGGGQWTKGKSCETFNPLGPWLVTPDELEPVGRLRLTTRVNDQVVQDGSCQDMIFTPVDLVRHISQFMVLEPGDVINTGTPAGVGHAMAPPRYLSPRDVVEVTITDLGSQQQRVIPWDGKDDLATAARNA